MFKDRLGSLLRGARWSGYAWHSLKRGGAACWSLKPGLPYFKWWGGWASIGVAMRYATAFLHHGVLAPLALPWPGSEVGEPQVVNCLSVWGSAMFGADAVDEALGYVGAVFGLARPHLGAVAVKPPATVVGGTDGGAPGHESDSPSTGSEGSSSCESIDLDGRIIEQPVRAGAPAGPAFRVEIEGQSAGRNWGGGGGTAKAQTASPPRPPSKRRKADVELGLWVSPVIVKGGEGWRVGGSGESLLEGPPHTPALCS